MRKLVPLHKQSKKQRKEYNAKQRGSWNGISPVTRIVPNGKAYDSAVAGGIVVPSQELCQTVKPMTEIELNEKITNLLSENPTQQKQSRRPYARENRVKKDDRLLRIIQRYYIPHAGYVDCGFDSTTLLHSGKYIKYPKHSHCQRWMKRLTSKKTRRCTDLVRKGNEYRRLFDYWWTLY